MSAGKVALVILAVLAVAALILLVYFAHLAGVMAERSAVPRFPVHGCRSPHSSFSRSKGSPTV